MASRPRTASGRFLLRLSPGLHAALRKAARAEGLSLNDYCARRLSLAAGTLPGRGDLAGAVSRAAGLFGGDLIAVAAFGSWARGEATAGSDVDLLVLLEDRVRIVRELYRAWDREPLRIGERLVEPHFVHLPPAERVVAGVWAEVAIDGIVLFDCELRLSSRLAAVRRDIASGHIVRRSSHGQPYWVLNEVA